MMNSLMVFQTDQNIIEVERQARASIEAYQLIIEELIKADIELNYTERFMPNSPRHRDLTLRREVIIETLSRFERPNTETPFLLPLIDITEHSFTITEKMFYLELYGKILETLYPHLELARLEEIDNMDRIEIIDLPQIPGRRSSPLRALLCITTFLAAFLFSSACVLLVSLISDEEKHKIRIIWATILGKRLS
jgi:capsule polysaccharide export protein KpsE/RkpR